MNGNSFYKVIFVFCLLLMFNAGIAQTATTVRVTADRNRILIGEPIQLTLEVDVPENEPIRFFTIDTIPHFEIEERGKIDSADTHRGTVLRQMIRITSFDSGHWVIPPFVLAEGIATDSIPVDVTFSDFDPQQDYHDVKDIIEVNPKEKEGTNWLWYAIGGGVLLIVVVLYFVLRKKKPAPAPGPVVVDPFEDAMKQLDGLARQKPEVKRYYSALVDIFRVYVLKKKDIHSMQKTTDDLVRQLRTIGIPDNEYKALSGILLMSDYVKFAKYVPSEQEQVNALDVIRKSIREIEQLK
jgi:hypothetical protein